jgi:hypothetical protein
MGSPIAVTLGAVLVTNDKACERVEDLYATALAEERQTTATAMAKQRRQLRRRNRSISSLRAQSAPLSVEMTFP